MLNHRIQKMMNLIANEKLLKPIFGVGGISMLSIRLTILLSVVLARALGAENYGEYTFITTFIWTLTIVVGPGIAQLITREVSKYIHEEKVQLFYGLRTFTYYFVFLYSLITASFSVIFSYINGSNWLSLFIGSLTIPIVGLTYANASFLRGLNITVKSQIPELLVKPSATILLVSICWYLGIISTNFALFSLFIACVIAWWVCHNFLSKVLPRQNVEQKNEFEIKNWLNALIPFSLLAAAGILNNTVAILVFGFLGDETSAGILKIAQTGSMLVSTSLVIVHQVVAPEITKLKVLGMQDQLKELFTKSTRIASLLSMFAALPFLFYGEEIVGLIYGNEYSINIELPIIILVVGQLLNTAFGLVGLFLVMTGHEKDSLFGQIFALLSNLVLCLLLMPNYGIIGASYAIAISTVIWNVVLGVRMYQRINILPGPF